MTEQKLTLNKIDRLKSIGSKSIGPIAALLALTGVNIYSNFVTSNPDSAIAAVNFTPKSEIFTHTKLPTPQQRMVGMYFSRNQAQEFQQDEQSVRSQVRYYHAQGINTLIVGVWGNGCAMYQSKVTKKLLGQASCPSKFPAHWLDWTIDEAHQQGMQVHAYFERGIKIDSHSPIYQHALARNWFVPGEDSSDSHQIQKVFDVENPEVIALYHGVMTEFVKRYPKIHAVQWDDYLAYSDTLPVIPGEDRAAKLTKFVKDLVKVTKQANPTVSFDLCALNPDWSKLHYSADWKQWHVDRTFVELYNKPSFDKEVTKYGEKSDGVAISERQFDRLPELIENEKVKSILFFSLEKKQQIAAQKMRLALAK
jgi:uncharacterized lipoprotein YddW (UPF0748 family)